MQLNSATLFKLRFKLIVNFYYCCLLPGYLILFTKEGLKSYFRESLCCIMGGHCCDAVTVLHVAACFYTITGACAVY